MANTHLLLQEPSGSKYEAAVRWEIPAVSAEWLYECARTGTKVAEGPYLVDKEACLNEQVESTVHVQLQNNKLAMSSKENDCIIINNNEVQQTIKTESQKSSKVEMNAPSDGPKTRESGKTLLYSFVCK